MEWMVAIALLRGTVAWLLATAAIDKALSGSAFEALLDARLGWERSGRARLATRLVVAVELGVAVALFIGPLATPSLLAAAVVFAVFAAVTGLWLARGIDGDCGCGGVMPIDTLSWSHVSFNATVSLLALGASLVMRYGSVEPLAVELEAMLLLLPLPVLIFASAARQLAQNARAQREVRA